MITDRTFPRSDHCSDSLIAFACLWLCVAGAILVAGDLATAAPLLAAAMINVWMFRSRRLHRTHRHSDMGMFAFNLGMALLVIAVSTHPWTRVPGLSAAISYYRGIKCH